MIQYTTLDALKLYLPNTGLSNEQLTALIAKGTTMLDVELGDNLGTQEVIRRLDGYGKPRIVVENTVNSVTSVSYLVGKTWTPATVDYFDGCTIHTEQELPRGNGNVKVIYSRGYATVPPDLEAFFLSYMSNLIQLAKGESGSLAGEVISKRANGLAITLRSPSEMTASLTETSFASTFQAIKNKYKNFNVLFIN